MISASYFGTSSTRQILQRGANTHSQLISVERHARACADVFALPSVVRVCLLRYRYHSAPRHPRLA